MINRKETFDNIRKEFGTLSQKQVDGFEAFFDEYEKRKIEDVRFLAYILATVWHEVKKTMQPIEEDGKGKGLRYGKKVWYDNKPYDDVPHIYYGRGLTQNTWRDNYLKLTRANLKGWDFVSEPNLLLDIEASVWATFHSMLNGLYTGKKLSHYFNETINDCFGARKIINGTDKAELIGNYHLKFLKSIV